MTLEESKEEAPKLDYKRGLLKTLLKKLRLTGNKDELELSLKYTEVVHLNSIQAALWDMREMLCDFHSREFAPKEIQEENLKDTSSTKPKRKKSKAKSKAKKK